MRMYPIGTLAYMTLAATSKVDLLFRNFILVFI